MGEMSARALKEQGVNPAGSPLPRSSPDAMQSP